MSAGRERLRARVEALSDKQRAQLAQELAHNAGASGRLVAYVIPSGDDATPGALAAFLEERLPDFMIPSEFVALDELPRTPAGKLDRRTLRAREPDLVTAEGSAPAVITGPRTEAERVLTKIWQSALDVDQIDVHDDFFELGGDSILSIRVIARANEAGLAITPPQFFAAPTIAELAAVADQAAEGAAEGAAE